jgi:hypothetical protein
MGTDKLFIWGGSRGSDHCACLTGSDVTGSHMTFHLPFPLVFPVLFVRTFFSRIPPTPRTLFPYFFPSYFFSRTYSKVATFEIQHFKILVSCFSSTCRYNTVHVPCGISIRTSTVGLPLEGWGACMRDLKGPTMNLFNPKEDWNVL